MSFLKNDSKSFFSFLKARTNFGIILAGATTFSCFGFIFCGKVILRSFNREINSNTSETTLWRTYRWSLDPSRRRKAALALVAKSEKSFGRKNRLLMSQGWGNADLASVAINLQAKTATALGEDIRAKKLWNELLQRFPSAPSSADSYYNLGRKEEGLRKQLLRLHPTHPAALASALEMGSTYLDSYLGVIHLARWGARWFGAQDLIRGACHSSLKGLTKQDHLFLASAMATLGNGSDALKCLKGLSPNLQVSLLVGEALLQGGLQEKTRGKKLLIDLIRENPHTFESSEALVLLSRNNYLNKEIIDSLPNTLANNSAIVDAERVRLFIDNNPELVISRWIDSPEIWQLQWELIRDGILKSEWDKSLRLLEIIPISNLPQPIAVRYEFWKGYIAQKKGRYQEANKIFKRIINSNPPGYYTWMSLKRIGKSKLIDVRRTDTILMPSCHRLKKLDSQYELVNQLWRFGLNQEAWETWTALNRYPSVHIYQPKEILVDSRLRISVGDEWTGLLKLSELSLRLIGEDYWTRQILHRSQHPIRFSSEIAAASKKTGLSSALIMSVIKQESRFSPGVISSSGAMGLMQLLPDTAKELAGDSFTTRSLLDPKINVSLGSIYLRQLLERWDYNLLLALASYNAGPSTVQGWVSSEVYSEPELWIERITYPETRIYIKKIIGSLWSYINLNKKTCSRV